jgi:hypothetical protein
VCTACGFDGAVYRDTALLAALRELGERWLLLLATCGEQLRVRPEPEVWSAIEYAAHTRDIVALHAYGVEQALTGDEPSYPPLVDDFVDSVASTYREADPVAVVDRLGAEACHLAQLADDAGAAAWSRGLTIGASRMDVRRMLEHALHDALHHIDDVERGLATLNDRRS